MKKQTVIELLTGIMDKQNEAVKEKKFDNFEDARKAERNDFYRCGVRDALNQAILLVKDIDTLD